MKLKGFTLIELLVVIGILGILATAVVLAINPEQQIARGRDLQRQSDLSSIQNALEQYRHDNNGYPSDLSTLDTTNPTTGVKYMQSIPTDPLEAGIIYNSGNYYYYLSPDSTYTLAACLENKESGPNIQTTDPAGGDAGNCASGTYYVVTNQ